MAASLDGAARTLRPIGERTVSGPWAGVRGTVVEVVVVELVVEVLVVGAEVGGVVRWAVEPHALASVSNSASPKPAGRRHGLLFALPTWVLFARPSMPRRYPERRAPGRRLVSLHHGARPHTFMVATPRWRKAPSGGTVQVRWRAARTSFVVAEARGLRAAPRRYDQANAQACAFAGTQGCSVTPAPAWCFTLLAYFWWTRLACSNSAVARRRGQDAGPGPACDTGKGRAL